MAKPVPRSDVDALLSDLEFKVESAAKIAKWRIGSAILFLNGLLSQPDEKVVFPRGRSYQSILELSQGKPDRNKSWWF